MAACGLKEIEFGIESADPKVLALVNKKINLEYALGLISFAHRLEVVVKLYFLVGLPGQDARSIGLTRKFMEDAAIEGYRAGRLSHRQVDDLLGLDYWQTEAFLKERGVPLNYAAADLEAENATLDRIFAQS